MKPDVLRTEIGIELESLHLVAAEVRSLLDDTRGREGTVRECTAAAGFLSQFYNGVESIMKSLVKASGAPMPAGDSWHVELAKMFRPGNTCGLPVLYDEGRSLELAEYRRCRHAVRNSYGHQLTWARLLPLLGSMPATLSWFEDNVRRALGRGHA